MTTEPRGHTGCVGVWERGRCGGGEAGQGLGGGGGGGGAGGHVDQIECIV